jgi:RNA polymerase sigma factor (sigma-70 family)
MGKASRIFDGLLVLRFRTGDKKALGILVRKYHGKLCRHACWYTGSKESAKDVVQDSWQKIILKIGQLEDPDKFGSWAMTIVRRKALDYTAGLRTGRSDQLRLQPENSAEAAGEEDLQADRIAFLKTAIRRLPGEQQEVLRLFYTENQSLIEIGLILEIPVGTVKSRLYHAREKLKSLINELK